MKFRFLFLLCFFSNLTSAQIRQELRKEIDVRDNGVDQVRVLGKRGLVVYGYVNERGAPDVLQIKAYSTDFKELAVAERDYPKRTLYSNSVVSSDERHIYFFYLMTNFEYLVLDYDTETHLISERSDKLGERFTPRFMRTMKDKLYIIGVSKGQPRLMVLSAKTGHFTFTSIPGDNKKRFVESIMEDAGKNKLAVYYRDGSNMKTSQFYVAFFDEEGDLLDRPLLIDKDENYSVIDGSITWMGEEDFIISGTYGVKNSSLASGIYFSKFVKGKQAFITYHSFTDFKDYFKFLPERQQARVERKAQRKKDKGREDFVKSFVEIHPILVKKDHYVFIGEVYYATYRTEYYSTTVNGIPTQQTRQVFDGYQYSHAVVAGIGQNGEMLFDHCFKMWLNIKPFSVVKNIRVSENGDQTSLFFSTGSQLKAVTVNREQLSERELGEIVSETEGDRVRYTSFTMSQYWYDNYYIVYGIQRIRNKENEEVEKRRVVFVLTKIAFDL